MSNDHIRRALARMGEAQNELHASLGTKVFPADELINDIIRRAAENNPVESFVLYGHFYKLVSRANGDETVLREYRAPASLIERAKAFVTWMNSPTSIGDPMDVAEDIVEALAAAQPEPEKAPASLIERAKAYMAHHDPYEGPAGYPEPPEDIIQDLAAAQPEPETAPASLIERAKAWVAWYNLLYYHDEPPEFPEDIVVALAAAKPGPASESCHVGDDELRERAEKAEAEVERLKQEFQVLVIQDDMAALLRACGISDHARPTSCHTILHDEVIPAVERAKQAEAERDEARDEVERLRNELEEVNRLLGVKANQIKTLQQIISDDPAGGEIARLREGCRALQKHLMVVYGPGGFNLSTIVALMRQHGMLEDNTNG